ncbi:MAG: PIG-L family deacetylase [Candidatus Gastranaerophilales bacterium]|nr:PIG-L family deacetylase [Candidatus Gastranaerophilales bacterium]
MKKISKVIKKIYEKIIFANRFLKLARFFHFVKIFPTELTFKKEDKCLLLAPHPDDETIGCGGILSLYPQNFDVICLTDGSHGGYNIDSKELKLIRANEFKNTMQEMGIKNFSLLPIEDRKLIKNYDIVKNIEILDYDYIFIPNYFDQHKDHKATTILLQKLLKRKQHKENVQIVFYEVWSALPIITHYVDILNILEKKKHYIKNYQSQLTYVDFLQGIIGLNQYRGMQTNLGYAEAFSILGVDDFLKL